MRNVGFLIMIKRYIAFPLNMISSFECIILISEVCRLLETKVKYRLHHNVWNSVNPTFFDLLYFF